MKRKLVSILTALALCLTLLPGTALAAEGDPGVTITYEYTNPVTLENGGIYVAAAGNNGIEKVDAAPEGGAYLEYNNGTLTVHGAFMVTARVTVNTDLTITGETGSSLEVTGVGPAFQLCGNSTVTLDGGVDFTAKSSAITIGAYSNYNVLKTFTTSNDYSGNIKIINTGAIGSSAVSYVALDLKSSASIAITNQVQYSSSYLFPESIMLKSNGNVTLSNVFWNTAPQLTVEGENIYIEQNGGPSVYSGDLLNITAKKDVTIVKGGTSTATTLIGSAEISAGGDVTISGGGVPVQAQYGGTGSLTVKNAQNVSITGKTDASEDSGKECLFPVPVTFENCGNVTVTDNGDGEILKEGVAVTSDCPWTATTGGKTVTMPSGRLTYGGDISSTLNSGRYVINSADPIVYDAGEGKVFYEPATAGGTAVLTLDGASFDDMIYIQPSQTHATDSSLQLELKNNNRMKITANASLTLTGSGSFAGELMVGGFTKNSTGTLNAVVGVLRESDSRYGYTVYGERSTSDSAFNVSTSVPLTIAEGAVLTVDTDDGLTINDFAGLTNNGTIINNAGIKIIAADTAADAAVSAFIKSLNLTGTGDVSVKKGNTQDAPTDTYTNSGTKLLPPAGTDGALDLSSANSDVTDKWGSEGYKWDADTKTLTLAEGFNATKVILPDDTIKIVTEGESRIDELTISGGSPQNTNLTFSGTGKLTIHKNLNISGNNNLSLTVDAGANVVANNGISIGASGGVDSIITVNGTLTAAQGIGGSAIYGGKVAVGDTGVLEVFGAQGVCLNGMTESGNIKFDNLFTVTGNGRFTANCSEYNVQVVPSGSFPDGTTAEGAINLGDEYMPDDCKAELKDGKINLVHISTGEVYSGPLTIHKNHIWETGWTADGDTGHYHACAFEGCTAKQPGSEAPHYYAHGADACRDCGHTRPAGTPDSGSGGSSGGSGSSSYAVTVEKASHGEVTSDRRTASQGDTVTLTVTPDSGYGLSALTVTDSRGNAIALTHQGGGTYRFTMPGRAVTVRAAFASSACTGGADCPSRAFSDLDTGKWYHEAVDYVLKNGLMSGYGSGLFGPEDNLTRAQFTQILHNKEGRPVVNYLLRYSDVADGAWYTEAIRWATSQGVVNGYGNGRFGPNDNITREQLAVMLWRYAGSPAAAGEALHFTDADQAGGYALDALGWAVENGILNGKGGGILDPKGLATRAQATQMLKNFLRDA